MKGKEVTLYSFFKNECDIVTKAWVCDNPAVVPAAVIEL